MSLRSLLPCLLAAGLMSACPTGEPHSHGTNIPCDEDNRDEPYNPGMEKETDVGLMTVVLDASTPGPIDIGNNDWTLSVSDPTTGEAETGCTITAVPWMVDHDHGSNTPVAEETDTPGTYEIVSVEITMAGLWDTELQLVCPNLGDDTVHFLFCIDG
jgi:hypothetical protein